MSIEWLTYAEAAKLLNIKADSAKKRAMRRHWPRLVGNDGKTRIQVPPECLGTVPEDITTDITPDIPVDTSPPIDDTRERLAASEARAEVLAAQVQDLQRERDRLLTLLETQPRGFLTRLFSRL